MPTIIDVTSSGTRGINAAMDGLQQSQQVLLPIIDRIQRQAAEQRRFALAEQEQSFRERQADRGFEFDTQQADRQQANADRSFGLQQQGVEQRQQLIDREIGQEDAAAEYYRGKLLEISPGPVGADQFQGMDAATLRDAYQTEMYAKQLSEARVRTQGSVKSVIEDYGLMATAPEIAEQLMALSESAVTVEDHQKVRETAWKIAEQTEKVRADAVLREQTVASMEPMLVGLAQRPAERAKANVATKQYLAGELDVRQFLSIIGDAVEAAQGGGERRTTGAIARQKMVDAYVTENPDATDAEIDMMVANADRLRDRIDGRGVQAAPAAAPGGAAAPDVLSRLGVKPDRIQKARDAVARQPDQTRQNVAVAQALQITGNPADMSDEEMAAVVAYLLGG